MQRKLGAILSYINVIVQNGVYLLYTPFLIHFLGQKQFGIYQLSSQIVSALGMLALGFSGAYVRFYWIEKRKSELHLSRLNGLYLLIFYCSALAAISAGIILMNNPQAIFNTNYSDGEVNAVSQMLMIMSINVGINFISSVFNSYILACEKFIFQQSRVFVSTLMQPVVIITLLALGFGVVYVATVQLIFLIGIMLLNIRYAIKSLHMLFSFGKGQVKLFKSISIFSGYILINQIVDFINNSVPGLIIGKVLDPVSVAIYAIAIQIRTVFYQLSVALSSVFVPKMNELVMGRDNDGLNYYLIRVGRIQYTLLTFILGGFIVLGKEFLHIWVGEGFELSYWIIISMVLPVIIPLSQNLGIEIQRAKNLHRFRSVVMAIFAVMNVLLTYLAVLNWGVIASGVGYIVGIAFANIIAVNIYNQKVVGLNMIAFWQNIIRISYVPIITTFGVLVFKSMVSFQGVSGIIYIGIAYTTMFSVLSYLFSLNDLEKKYINELVYKILYFRKRITFNDDNY